MATYITPKDTAKLIRAALKTNFPGTVFGVACRKGGSSINVRWTNGPTDIQVQAVTNYYTSATFDSMIDLESYHARLENGVEVTYGAHYVFTHRTLTAAFVQPVIASVCAKWGISPVPTVKAYGEESTADFNSLECLPQDPNRGDYHRELRMLVSRACAELDEAGWLALQVAA